MKTGKILPIYFLSFPLTLQNDEASFSKNTRGKKELTI